MPAIPSGLEPIAQGYSFGGPDGVIRTDVAGGAPRYAMDFDRGPQQFKITLVLDALQLMVWTTFYHRIIKKGSLAFDMDLDSGMGVQTHSCNMLPGSYSVARTEGILSVVSFSVEAESSVYSMSDAEAQSIVDVYNTYEEDSSALLARIAAFANVDTLVL